MNHWPPLSLPMCSGAHVLEFLRYLDQFGKTKVHGQTYPFFGLPNPPAHCLCPLRQAWGSLDALIERLRAAYEEHGGQPEGNPFGARDVRIFLKEVRDFQAKVKGVCYEKKRKRPKLWKLFASPFCFCRLNYLSDNLWSWFQLEGLGMRCKGVGDEGVIQVVELVSIRGMKWQKGKAQVPHFMEKVPKIVNVKVSPRMIQQPK